MGCIDDVISLADELCPPEGSDLNRFTEIIICEHLVIPPQKPEKELITNVLKNFVITDAEEIEVDLGDGTIRKKVAVTGVAKIGIEYSADMPEQQVHFAQFDIPFQGIIGYRPCNPDTNRGLMGAAFNLDEWNIHVCLEHEQYHQLSSREIKAVLVLLIWLDQ